MNTRQITLLPGATNIKILNHGKPDQTTLTFNSPAWGNRLCFHIVSGKWEIESINQNVVNLVNYDEVIPETSKSL